MKKCEWKDVWFEGCIDYRRRFKMYQGGQSKHKNLKLDTYWMFSFCPFCGADIRKPEPEVIIKKSGETWVARNNGVDYLCLKPNSFNEYPHDYYSFTKQSNDGTWKPISEIDITDKIAKLRPLLVSTLGGSDLYKLYGIADDKMYPFIASQGGFSVNQFKCSTFRLATVDDLESND